MLSTLSLTISVLNVPPSVRLSVPCACLAIIILRKHLKMMDENYRILQRMQIRRNYLRMINALLLQDSTTCTLLNYTIIVGKEWKREREEDSCCSSFEIHILNIRQSISWAKDSTPKFAFERKIIKLIFSHLQRGREEGGRAAMSWAITVRSHKFSVIPLLPLPPRCAHFGKLSTQTRNLHEQCQFEGAFECDQSECDCV